MLVLSLHFSRTTQSPPRSTLFPYTTLFRSNVGNLGNWQPTVDWAFADYRFKDWFGIRTGKVKTVLGLFNDTQDMEFLHTDRKSTRLNSSHEWISYAVFCLKKKNK